MIPTLEMNLRKVVYNRADASQQWPWLQPMIFTLCLPILSQGQELGQKKYNVATLLRFKSGYKKLNLLGKKVKSSE